jgi:HAD superfamily hydrolase (TIGR01509 family)
MDALIADLHKRKTDILLSMLEEGALPLHPGVRRLMEEINNFGLALGICTTSDARAARCISATILKGIRLDMVLAGDDVSRKQPDPEIYLRALRAPGLSGRESIAIEDSHNGIEAATRGALCRGHD